MIFLYFPVVCAVRGWLAGVAATGPEFDTDAASERKSATRTHRADGVHVRWNPDTRMVNWTLHRFSVKYTKTAYVLC